MNLGRPKLTPEQMHLEEKGEVIDVIEDMIMHGLKPKECCELHDINPITYYKWLLLLKRHPMFWHPAKERRAIVEFIRSHTDSKQINKAIGQVGISTATYYSWLRTIDNLPRKHYDYSYAGSNFER